MIIYLVLTLATARAAEYVTPTKAVTTYPQFTDDRDLRDMDLAISRQLDFFTDHPPSGHVRYGDKSYPASRLPDTLMAFKRVVGSYFSCLTNSPRATCQAVLNALIRRNFDVYQPDLKPGDPRYGEAKDSFFTVYATPTLATRQKSGDIYTHPVFARPSGVTKSRVDIDFHNALQGLGLELAYAPDLFSLYILHMEGSGYAQLPGNKGFYLSYAGDNGLRWNWISKYMQSKGYIQNPSEAAQRKYLRQHPEKWEEIYSTCPSYVFFKRTNDPPRGCGGVALTDGRAIATDRSLYALKGTLAFIQAERPAESDNYDFENEDPAKVSHIPFSRFFLDQDTGGAIKGKGRADLYFGVGPYAEYSAAYESSTGNLYFLMLKD